MHGRLLNINPWGFLKLCLITILHSNFLKLLKYVEKAVYLLLSCNTLMAILYILPAWTTILSLAILIQILLQRRKNESVPLLLKTVVLLCTDLWSYFFFFYHNSLVSTLSFCWISDSTATWKWNLRSFAYMFLKSCQNFSVSRTANTIVSKAHTLQNKCVEWGRYL